MQDLLLLWHGAFSLGSNHCTTALCEKYTSVHLFYKNSRCMNKSLDFHVWNSEYSELLSTRWNVWFHQKRAGHTCFTNSRATKRSNITPNIKAVWFWQCSSVTAIQYLWGDGSNGIWNTGAWLSALGVSWGCCSESLNMLLEQRALAGLWVAEQHTYKCEQTQECRNSSSYHSGGEQRLVI